MTIEYFGPEPLKELSIGFSEDMGYDKKDKNIVIRVSEKTGSGKSVEKYVSELEHLYYVMNSLSDFTKKDWPVLNSVAEATKKKASSDKEIDDAIKFQKTCAEVPCAALKSVDKYEGMLSEFANDCMGLDILRVDDNDERTELIINPLIPYQYGKNPIAVVGMIKNAMEETK